MWRRSGLRANLHPHHSSQPGEMINMENEEHVWHREVINAQVERTLRDLTTLGVFGPYYLAGGTGLALHLGHRRSQDLDFMSGEPVDPETLIQKMQRLGGFALAARAPGTLHAAVEGVKVSFLAYPYPLLFPFATFLDVNIADPRDIACMKLSAIGSRGAKRDFVDLYVVAKQYGLPRLLEWFARKYAEVNLSLVHVLKSLVYFEDAEKDPVPDMLEQLSWEEVKRFFSAEVSRLSP
jgi:nucleotidyltransferase AbiEii toxin of type IV toxin-antitoxin system